ncbi:unnamed protein product [Soboliphyme baturini]|uniref:Uncharacterized protein n=1 Tax=Soboliphyme baturini TaxID=241478 RepID=A0A3P7ZTL3_9BILA|nr:unnamed protein product [Soboliphyme baturini]
MPLKCSRSNISRVQAVRKLLRFKESPISISRNCHVVDVSKTSVVYIQVFGERQDDLTKLSKPLEITCFRTSIWDETLYKAWSSIVYKLVPNVQQLEASLEKFGAIIDADEVLLFEKATFLVISHCQRKAHKDVHRFEKLSNFIKQFKLSCSKLGTHFSSMEILNSNFAAYIDDFTANTYVLVVLSDSSVCM